MALVPGAVQSDAGLVDGTDSSPTLEDISATSLRSLKNFITAVSTRTDVHFPHFFMELNSFIYAGPTVRPGIVGSVNQCCSGMLFI